MYGINSYTITKMLNLTANRPSNKSRTWRLRMTYQIRTQPGKFVLVDGLPGLVTDIWMAAEHKITFRVIMELIYE